jgi:glycosyltransferase involved in cell wall biosynthesis
MLRRDFDALGGFDEQFGVAGEDINLCVGFQTKLGKSIRYCAEATGIHVENVTRRETGERLTPPEDLLRIRQCAARLHSPGNEPGDGVRLSIHTEEPGWIMHRKAAEIQKLMKNTTINEDVWDADIHYYINYGYYFRSARHAQRRGLKVANFTHFDPDSLSEQFREAARVMDHCVSVSDETTKILRDFGVPEEKITTIVVGADIGFEPKLTLGIVGRVYKGGRKGEHLVNALLEDDALMAGLRIVATNEDWGVPVWNFDEQADFYRSVDYLLVPALIEGGPVPFMEALACGTLAIAPPIGVVPQFPHIPYRTGEIDSLKQVIQRVKSDFLQTRRRTASAMAGVDWLTWSLKHQRLVSGKEYVQISRCCVVPGYQAVSARRVMSAVESKPKQIKPESKDDS